MSDSENSQNVSVEVRELLELVLKEPVDTNNGTSSPDEQKVNSATEKDNSMLSMDIQAENDQIAANENEEPQRKDVPIATEENISTKISDTVASIEEPDLRLIESNALKLIAQYGSDSDSDGESSGIDTESSDEVVAIDDVVEVALHNTITQGNYRVVSSDSEEDSSSCDDSDVEVISVRNEIINLDDDDIEESDTKPKGPIRAEGEFTIDSLPPIEDLKISVPEDECVVLGKVMSIVDQLVVVDSLPGSRPIDIDSVLFLERGTKPLGHVFDVLGNISSPMYCVRFNSNKQIKEKGITVGSLVYVAPRTEHTSFVVVSELMKQKGCDASWKNDIEPMNAQDFSDDEEERKARRMRRGRNNSSSTTTNQDNDDDDDDDDRSATASTPNTTNGQRNTNYRAQRRRRGGNFYQRGGHNDHNRNNYSPSSAYHHPHQQQQQQHYQHQQNRNYGPPAQHSWHQNLSQSQNNWNSPSPMRNNVQMMGQYPQPFLLPPPPPPPSHPSNSYW